MNNNKIKLEALPKQTLENSTYPIFDYLKQLFNFYITQKKKNFSKNNSLKIKKIEIKSIKTCFLSLKKIEETNINLLLDARFTDTIRFRIYKNLLSSLFVSQQ